MSARISHICLSDLHLGDPDSLLTKAAADPDGQPGPSAVLLQLVNCLRTLSAGQAGPLPTLVLNGDILELAFGPMSHALAVFERFLDLLTEPGRELVGRIVYVPGNHDHHVWELARETQFARELEAWQGAGELPAARHTTGLELEQAVPDRLLGAMLEHARGSSAMPCELRVAYPNFVLYDAQCGRAVLFHHGHLAEKLYRVFSRGREWLFPGRPSALSVEQIEAENFAWIEFVWSLLGRSGAAGSDVETLFEMLRYPKRVEAYIRDLTQRVAPQIRMPFLPFNWMRRYVIGKVLRRLTSRVDVERLDVRDVCSPRGMRGIQAYLFGPAYRQLEEELGELPSDLSFVFGHTHKPFEKSLRDPVGRPVQILNTGGWTIETARPESRYGASVVLISEELETATLRIFHDLDPGEQLQLPDLRPAPGAEQGVFYRAVQAAVMGEDGGEWRQLAECIVQETASKRAQHIERYGG